MVEKGIKAAQIQTLINNIKTRFFSKAEAQAISFMGETQVVGSRAVDSTPTTGSINLVTSGGVKDAIDNAYNPDNHPISDNIITDKTSNTKLVTPKSVYDFILPSTQPAVPSGGMLPNILYNLGTLTGIRSMTLATPADNTVINHYFFTFNTGPTAPTISWDSKITKWNGGSAPTINANKHYEISVLNGYGAFLEI